MAHTTLLVIFNKSDLISSMVFFFQSRSLSDCLLYNHMKEEIHCSIYWWSLDICLYKYTLCKIIFKLVFKIYLNSIFIFFFNLGRWLFMTWHIICSMKIIANIAPNFFQWYIYRIFQLVTLTPKLPEAAQAAKFIV